MQRVPYTTAPGQHLGSIVDILSPVLAVKKRKAEEGIAKDKADAEIQQAAADANARRAAAKARAAAQFAYEYRTAKQAAASGADEIPVVQASSANGAMVVTGIAALSLGVFMWLRRRR